MSAKQLACELDAVRTRVISEIVQAVKASGVDEDTTDDITHTENLNGSLVLNCTTDDYYGKVSIYQVHVLDDESISIAVENNGDTMEVDCDAFSVRSLLKILEALQ